MVMIVQGTSSALPETDIGLLRATVQARRIETSGEGLEYWQKHGDVGRRIMCCSPEGQRQQQRGKVQASVQFERRRISPRPSLPLANKGSPLMIIVPSPFITQSRFSQAPK